MVSVKTSTSSSLNNHHNLALKSTDICWSVWWHQACFRMKHLEKTVLQDLYSCTPGDYHNHGICEVAKSTTKLNFMKQHSNVHQGNSPALTYKRIFFLVLSLSCFLIFFSFPFLFIFFPSLSLFLFYFPFFFSFSLFFLPFYFFSLFSSCIFSFPSCLYFSLFYFLSFIFSVLFSLSFFSFFLFFCIKQEHLTHSYDRLRMHFQIIGN